MSENEKLAIVEEYYIKIIENLKYEETLAGQKRITLILLGYLGVYGFIMYKTLHDKHKTWKDFENTIKEVIYKTKIKD